MQNSKYDKLLIKYKALIEENICLREKIKNLEAKPDIIKTHAELSQSQREITNNVCENKLSQNDFDCEKTVNKYSQINEKIALFMSMFKGRQNVYAKRWENKKGKSGYSPVCMNFDIPIVVERSRSGNGGHAWFFFEESISARLARKLGSSLLTYSMSNRHEISFKS